MRIPRLFFLKAVVLLAAAAAQPAMAQQYYIKKKTEQKADPAKPPAASPSPAAKTACNAKEQQAMDRLTQALEAMNAEAPSPADRILARQMQDILNDPEQTPRILALFAKCRYGVTF